MTYARKYKKKPYKKRNYRSRGTFRKKVAAIAKTVALRQAETKHWHTNLSGTIYHNGFHLVKDNIVALPQGFQDNRQGDEIILRGVKLMFYIECPIDRPNVNFRLIIGRLAPNASGIIRTKGLTGRTINDPLDRDYYQKIYKDMRWNQICDTYGSGSGDSRKQYSIVKNIWIPFNNQKYRFENHSALNGRDYEYQVGLTAFDVDGTLITDVLATYSCSVLLYYKDP